MPEGKPIAEILADLGYSRTPANSRLENKQAVGRCARTQRGNASAAGDPSLPPASGRSAERPHTDEEGGCRRT